MGLEGYICYNCTVNVMYLVLQNVFSTKPLFENIQLVCFRFIRLFGVFGELLGCCVVAEEKLDFFFVFHARKSNCSVDINIAKCNSYVSGDDGEQTDTVDKVVSVYP